MVDQIVSFLHMVTKFFLKTYTNVESINFRVNVLMRMQSLQLYTNLRGYNLIELEKICPRRDSVQTLYHFTTELWGQMEAWSVVSSIIPVKW